MNFKEGRRVGVPSPSAPKPRGCDSRGPGSTPERPPTPVSSWPPYGHTQSRSRQSSPEFRPLFRRRARPRPCPRPHLNPAPPRPPRRSRYLRLVVLPRRWAGRGAPQRPDVALRHFDALQAPAMGWGGRVGTDKNYVMHGGWVGSRQVGAAVHATARPSAHSHVVPA